MSIVSWLKGLKLAKFFKSGSTIAKVGEAVKVSKITQAIRELPIIRLAAGSAVGVVIIESWNKAVSGISDTFGTSEGISTIILGCVAAVVIAVILSAILSIFRGKGSNNTIYIPSYNPGYGQNQGPDYDRDQRRFGRNGGGY